MKVGDIVISKLQESGVVTNILDFQYGSGHAIHRYASVRLIRSDEFNIYHGTKWIPLPILTLVQSS